jgi:hypothetical protein
MLTIRSAQLQVFEADVRHRVKRSLLADLSASLPPFVTLPSGHALAALLDQCEDSIDRYDGNFMRDARGHLLLALEFGADFETEGWARSVLDDPEIPGTSKLDVLKIHAAQHRKRLVPCR